VSGILLQGRVGISWGVLGRLIDGRKANRRRDGKFEAGRPTRNGMANGKLGDKS
jgi:hypothetical protein